MRTLLLPSTDVDNLGFVPRHLWHKKFLLVVIEKWNWNLTENYHYTAVTTSKAAPPFNLVYTKQCTSPQHYTVSASYNSNSFNIKSAICSDSALSMMCSCYIHCKA